MPAAVRCLVSPGGLATRLPALRNPCIVFAWAWACPVSLGSPPPAVGPVLVKRHVRLFAVLRFFKRVDNRALLARTFGLGDSRDDTPGALMRGPLA